MMVPHAICTYFLEKSKVEISGLDNDENVSRFSKCLPNALSQSANTSKSWFNFSPSGSTTSFSRSETLKSSEKKQLAAVVSQKR